MARTRQVQDFVGFQFNGRHSSEFGLKVVSNSNRFQDNFGPTFKDNTVKVPGGDGNFYWNTENDKKEWNLNVAFEDVTEVELREMRQWLNSKAMGELIFDEEPYKAYKVKMKSPAQFKYLCFDKETEGDEPYTSTLIHNHTLAPSQESEAPAQSVRNVERVYKGEGTIAFVAYQPYAESVYEDLESYVDAGYTNVSEWADASGISQATSDTLYRGTVQANGTFSTWNNPYDSLDTSAYWSFLGQTALRYATTVDRTINTAKGYWGIVQNTSTNMTAQNSLYFYQTKDSDGNFTVPYGWIDSKKNLIGVTIPLIKAESASSASNWYKEQRQRSRELAKFLYFTKMYTIYNPGDLETDWTLRFPRPSTNTTVTIALWSGATQPDSIVEFTTQTDNYTDGQYIEISSRTQLIRVLNSDFTTTSFLLNTGLSRDGFFKIPVTTDPSKYSVQISGIDPSGQDVSFKYKYLYY